MFPQNPDDFWGFGQYAALTPSAIKAALQAKRRPHESPECKCDGCLAHDVAKEAARRETD